MTTRHQPIPPPPATACPACGLDHHVHRDLVACLQGVLAWMAELEQGHAGLSLRGKVLRRYTVAILEQSSGGEDPKEPPAARGPRSLFDAMEERETVESKGGQD